MWPYSTPPTAPKGVHTPSCWHWAASPCALHFAHYNFCRVHSSLRVTPAMAAGVSDRVWELEELIAA
jgi:hypothetical protein